MEARIKFFILVLISVAGFSHVLSAQPVATPPETGSLGDANAPTAIAFPYVALITGNNVHIRSGPGTNYYRCAKLSKGDKVTVVGSHYSWSRVVPPAGSFCWISMRYVKAAPSNIGVGIVTGNAVPVYVGSVYMDPIQSTQTQLTLSKDEEVRLLGPGQSDYYKIEPPAGDYRWISSMYAQAVPSKPGPVQPPPGVIVTDIDIEVDINTPPEANVPPEQAMVERFYSLREKLNLERRKPIELQDYTALRQAFRKIAENKQAGKAVRYAQFALGQIKRFELAQEVISVIKLQDQSLRQARIRIERGRAQMLAELKQLGQFAVIGKLQRFATYGPGHYRIVDDSSGTAKTLCCALPTGPAENLDISEFIGRKVGLIGKIEPHPATAGAAVKFTRIVELD